MKRRERSHSPKLRSTPTLLVFHEWRKRFASSLIVGTPASKAFGELVKQEAQFREQFHLPKLLDLRRHVMEGIYRETSAVPQQNNEPLIKALKKLVAQLGVVLTAISRTGGKVESQGGLGLDLSADLHFFHKARNSATAMLELLEVKGPESLRRDPVDQCLWFLETLEGLVPESQACDLARLALKAHGYPDDALTDLKGDKVHSGKVRKRKLALQKRYEDTLLKIKSYSLRQ